MQRKNMWEYGFWQLMETWFTDPLHITGISYGARNKMPLWLCHQLILRMCCPVLQVAAHLPVMSNTFIVHWVLLQPLLKFQSDWNDYPNHFFKFCHLFFNSFFSPWEALSSARGDFELLCNGARLRLSGAAQWQRFQRQHPLARNDRTIFSETTGGSGEEIQLDRPGIWRAMLKNQGTTDFAEFPR